MANTAVKPEIKLDPSEADGPALSQLDEFEEDNDLHIPDPNGSQAWLVKIPPHLWAAWNDIYQNAADETPIEIGKMRVYNAKEGETPMQQKIQIRLTPGVPQHVELPKNYDMTLKSVDYNNTVVFNEKDQPGHQGRRDVAGRARAHLKPAGIPPKSERYGTASGIKPGTYRSAIPKQTALAPVIQHVADATPVQDASYDAWTEKAYKAAMQPKRKTKIYHGLDLGMHPGNRSANFTLTSRVGAGRKPPPKEKAVRMDQGALLDRIYQCFRKYRFWSLRALKNELKQPEAYIKQTLESIAVLVRSGDFAMNYKLKDEYESVANIKPDEVKDELPEIKSEDEGSVAEDAEMESGDDDDDFEDVKMEAARSDARPASPRPMAARPDLSTNHDDFIASQMEHAESYHTRSVEEDQARRATKRKNEQRRVEGWTEERRERKRESTRVSKRRKRLEKEYEDEDDDFDDALL